MVAADRAWGSGRLAGLGWPGLLSDPLPPARGLPVALLPLVMLQLQWALVRLLLVLLLGLALALALALLLLLLCQGSLLGDLGGLPGPQGV